MDDKKDTVITVYGHNTKIDKILIKSIYNSEKLDVKKYCDEVKHFELIDRNYFWIYAKIICENMEYTLDDLFPIKFYDIIMKLDNLEIQRLLRKINTNEIAISIINEPEELKEKIFINMSKRASQILKDEIELIIPVRENSIKENQKNILNIIFDVNLFGQIFFEI